MPVPDPLKTLPAPTKSTDPNNVNTTSRGGVTVVGLPLIGPPITLQLGVYDYISVVSGIAKFNPGVYIIRGTDPLTGVALSIVGGTATASGVMFYITNSSSYNTTTGMPDTADGEGVPAAPSTTKLLPSVLINAALPGNSFSPLADSSSPFNGMLIYQRRQDYRPIVVAYQNLIGNSSFKGAIYAKYGQFLFVADGTHDLRSVTGSATFVTVLGLTLSPSQLFAPAYDVFLLE